MRRLVTLILSLATIQTTLIAQPLELCTAWQRITDHSPRLTLGSLDIEALEGERCQVSLYPNPLLGVDVGNVGGSHFYEGYEAAEVAVGITQPIVTAGKICKRVDVANALITQAEWELEAVKQELREKLERAFAHVAVLQERYQFALKNLQVSNASLQATNQLVESGKISVYLQKKAAIALRYAEINLQKATVDLNVARQELAQLWGGCEPDFDCIVFPLHEIRCPPSLDSLLCKLDDTPQSYFADSNIYAADKAVIAARAQQYPDFLLNFGYQAFKECDDHAFFVGVDIPIPVFDRNQGNIRKAEALRTKAEYAKTLNYNQTVAEVKAAHQGSVIAYNRAIAIRQGLLKELEEAHALTLDGYNQGKLGYVDLLDAQRLLFESNQDYLEALLDYHYSLAAIKRLTGAACYLTY